MEIWHADIILIGVLIYREIMHALDRRVSAKREEDLLNRVMSRDFPEYVDGRKVLELKADPRGDLEMMEEQTDGLGVT